jgi:radical SAM-linked protein
MVDIKVYFNKIGRVKFIAHLDTYRTFIRAFRRTDIPVWYTEGFNPQVYLNFTLPVSLGVESYNDSFIFRLVSDYPLDEIPDELNKYLPEGITCLKAELANKKEAPIVAAEYEIIFDNISKEDLESILSRDDLTYEKMGKIRGRKTTKVVNLSENILSYDVTDNGNTVTLNIKMTAGSSLTPSPVKLCNSLGVEPVLMKRLRIIRDS